MSDFVYWLVVGCITLSFVLFFVMDIRGIRGSETKQEVSEGWSGMLRHLLLFPTLIFLFADGSLGDIVEVVKTALYNWGVYNVYWHECATLLVFALLYFIVTLPVTILTIFASDNRKEEFKKQLLKLFAFATIPAIAGYLVLIGSNIWWGLVPFAVVAVVVLATEFTSHSDFNHMSLPKAIYNSVVYVAVILGLGYVVCLCLDSYMLSDVICYGGTLFAANFVVILASLPIIVYSVVVVLGFIGVNTSIPMKSDDLGSWLKQHPTIEVGGETWSITKQSDDNAGATEDVVAEAAEAAEDTTDEQPKEKQVAPNRSDDGKSWFRRLYEKFDFLFSSEDDI